MLLAALVAHADVRLAGIFSDNMVLQREMKVPVWGWAAPGEAVAVSCNGQQVAVKADEKGAWKATLAPMKEGGPYDLTVAGANTVTLKNVLVGDVWICSGQSNMEMSLYGCAGGTAEAQAANLPNIRVFTIARCGDITPQADCTGTKWQALTTYNVTGSTYGAAYYFAKDLQQKLNVPIGLVQCAWSGSVAEGWCSRETLEADPDLKPLMQATDNTMQSYARDFQEKYLPALHEWGTAAEVAKAAGKPLPTPPTRTIPQDPRNAGGAAYMATLMYYGEIKPIAPFAMKGVIWYQGESNAFRPSAQYRKLFPAMIRCWRETWGQGDFPFLFVQLASYMARAADPGESQWAELREAQAMALYLPNTAMATAIDIGEAASIHPLNKADVGKRLALCALGTVYGEKIEYSGPVFAGMVVEGNKIRIKYTHLGGGLTVKGDTLKGFSICGADKKYVWADAVVDGDTVLVSSPQVPEPKAVRYAWTHNPECNLYNKAGLPATPFRTDGPLAQ
jgi:sialate O-acetylesterase